MIEIKRWTDGKVLYVAELASDVKTALEEAVKENANLGSANLGYANLGSANLGYADLGSADLRSANLGYADLGYADLGHRHPLWAFWADFCSVLDAAPCEVGGLRLALVEGRVDGSVYEGECACLVGTIANVRDVDIDKLEIPQDASRPAEQWFMPIRKGDVALDDPAKATDSEGVFRASVAVAWIDGWITSRRVVGVVLRDAA